MRILVTDMLCALSAVMDNPNARYYCDAEDIKRQVPARQVAEEAGIEVKKSSECPPTWRCAATWRGGKNPTSVEFFEDGMFKDYGSAAVVSSGSKSIIS